MKDTNKAKEQFIGELSELRQRIAAMEAEVGERTRGLKKANEQIQKEMDERKKIEEETRGNERFLKFVFDGISDGLSVLDTELNIVRVNKWIEKMYPESTPLEGKKCYQVYQKRNSPCLWCPSLSALKAGQPHSEIVPYPSEERPTGWIDLSAYPLRDDEGLVIGVIEHINDITALKQAEDRITRLNAVLRALRNVNRIMITEKERDRLVKAVCATLTETRGYHNAWIALFDESRNLVTIAESGLSEAFVPMAEQVKGGTLTDCAQKAISQSSVVVIADPLSACTECPLSKMYAGRGAMAVRLEHEGKVYGLLCVSIPVNFITDEEERSLLKELAEDITFALYSIEAEEKRKRIENAIQESEEKYRTLAETVTDSIFTLDTKGKFAYLNPAIEKITGYKAQDLIGRPFTKALAPEYIESTADRFRRGLSGETIPMYEVELLHKDGKKIPVELNVTSLLDADGKAMGRIGIARDITERKRSEEEKKKLQAQLKQAQKMEAIGTLAGGIAHDFNNILAAIIGYSELAKMKVPECSDVISDLDEVLKAGDRAKNLIKQILTFSRQGEEERKPMQINLIVKEVLKLLRPSLPTTIEIRQNIASAATVLVHPMQIHQMMMNLCANAYHAMREKGGVLEVSMTDVELDSEFTAKHMETHPGPYMRLTVSDTGHGIEKKDIDRIFEPYFTTKKEGEGTGIGLAIAHGIVKGHDGSIIVYSEPGKGTTLHVFLPRIEREVTSEPEEMLPLLMGKERILFVDDEIAIVDIGKRMLERLGYTVETRTSPIEALAAFRAQPEKFDLVVTDMTMPQMTGDELAKELMTIRSDVPIILCTGFSESITKEGAKEMGIREFAMKPFVMRDLANVVRRILDG